MGIRKRIKKILPIIGSGSRNQPIRDVTPAPVRRAAPMPEPQEPVSPRGDADPQEWIKETVGTHPVVLFMKGHPGQPQCGFSANAAGILSTYKRPFHTVDVLSDPLIRSGVKDFSSWPTIPQIYIGGEFVGGSDILSEMHGNGELKEALEEAFAETSPEASQAD